MCARAARLGGCGGRTPPAQACIQAQPADVLQALTARARHVALADGTPLSQCVRRTIDDSHLQALGATLTTAADALAQRMRHERRGGVPARLPDRRDRPRRRSRQPGCRASWRTASRALRHPTAVRAVPCRAAAAGRRGGDWLTRARCRPRTAQWAQSARMRLRLYHHGDGARVAYREAGAGPGLGAVPLARLLAPRVGAGRRAALAALPRRAAGPAAARRQRGPPAPPLHARLARRGRRGLLRRGARPASAASAATTSAPSCCCAPCSTGGMTPRRLVLMPNRLHRRAEHRAGRSLWRGAAMAAAVPGLDRLLARGAPLVFRPALGEKLSRAAQSGGARPRAPRARRRAAATPVARARGRSSRGTGRASRSASCSTATAT